MAGLNCSSPGLSCGDAHTFSVRTDSQTGRWIADAPDALAAEFASRDVTFSVPLKDTQDGLRGFELRDTDGYVLFFGRPRTSRPRAVEPA
jgi:hypothetical protein